MALTLNTTVAGNSLEAWGIALGLFLLTWVGLTAARALLLRRLPGFMEAVHVQWPQVAVVALQSMAKVSILAGALYAASHALELDGKVANAVFRVVFLILLLQLAKTGRALILHWVEVQSSTEGTLDGGKAQSLRAIGFLGSLVLYVTLALWGLDNFGVNITALVAGLGVGGIAIALAVQNILGDLFASLTIVLDKPFVIGDFVIVGEFRGTVENVGLKTTRVRSLSGEQLIFPNADLLQSRIRNYKRMKERRIEFQIGVTYDTDLQQLKELSGELKRIVSSMPKTRFERAHFMGLGASSLNFEVIYWVLDADYLAYMEVHQNILLQVTEEFRRRGVEFAFPTQTIHLAPAAANPTAAG